MAKHCEVPKTTIQDRLTRKSNNMLGRPTELTVEESIIVERLLVTGMWGFSFEPP